MQITPMDRAVILGASRGLGAELVREISNSSFSAFGFGRKEPALQALKDRHPLFDYRIADFSLRHGQEEVIRFLLQENFSKIFCVAAGGPYGLFQEREWKDHQWAWEVSFVFHARVLHALLAAQKLQTQVIVIGSSIAESEPDPQAASYCAAKHALKGLVRTLRVENPSWDLRLFSPGYMDTEMLPRHAAVRQQGVYDPARVAHELWLWSLSADDTGHKVYPKHPSDKI